MNFGDNLRNLRKARKLSQEKLAEKLEVSRQSVSKWENGEAYPEMKNIMLLCDIFHCKINDLVNENMTDVDSMDEEVKQNVVKFKEQQQKRMKIISRVIYVISKISAICIGIVVVSLIIATVVFPVFMQFVEIGENYINIPGKSFEYSVKDKNILTINGNRMWVETLTDLQEFIPSHSKTFYIISGEYILVSLAIQLTCLFLLMYNVERIYKNIHDGDTPFTIENVKRMNAIAVFSIAQMLVPKIFGILYSLVTHLDLAIEFKLSDIVIVLIVLSLTYIFKYGYEIQRDSNGKIYGKVENEREE